MATYWKSIPRKFCDFCKCWITDNKPSVDFHERGKRHKENVKKRIEEVKKKSYEKSQLDEEKNKNMKKMEKAALVAFMKDLESDPDLKARYLAKKGEEATESNQKEVDTGNKDGMEWYEASSGEGHTYYWSSYTGESIWEAPKEYITLAEQNKKNSEKELSEKKERKENKKKSKIAISDTALSGEITNASTMKDKIKVRDDSVTARRTYGSWVTVHEEIIAAPPESVEDIPLPMTKTEEPKRERFKEKKVTTLGSSTNVAFKKRKITSGARNVRHRDDND